MTDEGEGEVRSELADVRVAEGVNGQLVALLTTKDDQSDPDDQPESNCDQGQDEVQDMVDPSALHKDRIEISLGLNSPLTWLGEGVGHSVRKDLLPFGIGLLATTRGRRRGWTITGSHLYLTSQIRWSGHRGLAPLGDSPHVPL